MIGMLLFGAATQRLTSATAQQTATEEAFTRLQNIAFAVQGRRPEEGRHAIAHLDMEALTIRERGVAARTKVLSLEAAIRHLVHASRDAYRRGNRSDALLFAETATRLAEHARQMPVADPVMRQDLEMLSRHLSKLPKEVMQRVFPY